MTTEQQGASWNPDDMIEGGAVPSGHLQLMLATWVTWDYGGRGPATFALKLNFKDDFGNTSEQYYSAGDATKWHPSADGEFAVASGAQDKLSRNSNAGFFLRELTNAGYPKNRMGEKISALNGLYAHYDEKVQPPRPGLKQAEGEQRQRTSAVPTVIHNLPWEAFTGPKTQGATPTQDLRTAGDPATAAPTVQAPTTAAPAAAVAPAATTDHTAKAMALVAEVAAGKNGASFERQDVAAAVFKNLAADPDRDAISTLVFGAEFAAVLGQNGYKLEGDTITKA